MALVADRKSTRLNSSHLGISYAVFCLKKKKIVPANGSARSLRRANTRAPIGTTRRSADRARSRAHVARSVGRRGVALLFSFFLNKGAPPEIPPFPLPDVLPS